MKQKYVVLTNRGRDLDSWIWWVWVCRFLTAHQHKKAIQCHAMIKSRTKCKWDLLIDKKIWYGYIYIYHGSGLLDPDYDLLYQNLVVWLLGHYARDHINSYPCSESHYCRASTTREYLHSALSVDKMYRMYCDNYTELPPVSLHMYREIFTTEFNLAFLVPKKRQMRLLRGIPYKHPSNWSRCQKAQWSRAVENWNKNRVRRW